MCGIVGIFDRGGAPVDERLLARMTGRIQHRGPDGEGHFIAPGVGIGMRRLSIIDLDGGNQPLTNEDRTLQVVFNGEIYNYIELRAELITHGHQFKTHSDTEVIVHAYEQWGADCVSRFNGMFAFALWDGRKRELLLARDHLGIKPLYYTTVGPRVLFASEVKALLEDPRCPREVSLNGLGQLFSLRFVPAPDTLFAGIHKLPAGHRMTLSASGMRVQRYWNRKPELRSATREAQLIEEYQFLLEDAVRLQMRSDVPVGLFLSSGVDSSTILALMSRYSAQPVRTFTIGFEDNEGSDETAVARETARRFGAQHSEMIVTADQYQKYYDHYLWDLEEPLGNESAAAFFFVSKIARQQVKVALNGQGADEPWAGYDRYKGVQLSRLYSKLPGLLTGLLASPAVERLVRDERVKRGLLSLHERDVLSRFVKIYSFFSPAMKAQLFQPWVREHLSVDGQEAREAIGRLQDDVASLDPLTQMLYIDTRADLPDDLLMVCDKTSMANSLEARVPFLDVRLVEFIETLPPAMKLRRFQGKYLHKKACRKYLPESSVYRKKLGFGNPVDKWFRDHMRRYVDECLLNPDSAVRRYFDPECIRGIVKEHEAGRQDYMRQIQLLISFELWHRMFISATPAPGAVQEEEAILAVAGPAVAEPVPVQAKESRASTSEGLRYAVISPVRNESTFLNGTYRSLAAQTIAPAAWVIVDDGSTDATPQIADKLAAECPWIRVVHRLDRGYRESGTGVAEAFNDGLQALDGVAWDYLVKLDGDLTFAEDYFARCFAHFAAEPLLGVGGGWVVSITARGIEREPVPAGHVRGATKIYRRECWNSIRKLFPAPGWDTLDEITANVAGWESRAFEDLEVTQQRKTGGADGWWRTAFKNGRADYVCRNNPLFMCSKIAWRMVTLRPYVVRGLALGAGYFSGFASQLPRAQDDRVVAMLRRRKVERSFARKRPSSAGAD